MTVDLRQTIIPKSDQLNADDLIGRSLTIKVTKVSLSAAKEQPIAINWEGDGGKPYFPCKSMRRVLVQIWGPDGNAYVGRSMTLYRDDAVSFGGMQVGGIRISHMSDMTRPVTLALTATRANRKPFTVQPLKVSNDEEIIARIKAALANAKDQKTLEAIINHKDAVRLTDRIASDYDAALVRVSPPPSEESA